MLNLKMDGLGFLSVWVLRLLDIIALTEGTQAHRIDESLCLQYKSVLR